MPGAIPCGFWWEGQKACADLKRTGYLQKLRLEETSENGSARGGGLDHFLTSRDVRHVCRELTVYRKYLNTIRQQIELCKGRQEWLSRQANSFGKKADSYVRSDPELGRDLTKIVKQIEQAKRGLRLRYEREWTRPVGIFAAPFRGHTKVVQARELDSWFQVRLAFVFRADMPKNPFPKRKEERGPSLRTIARLIVLFLVCADLAEEKEGQVTLKHNRRPITVDGVLQQLRGAGIDRGL
jgi:hypothetical protein